MRRPLALATGLVAGVVVGAVLMLGVQSLTSIPGTTIAPAATITPSSTTTVANPGVEVEAPPPVSDQVLLVWTPGGIPAGLADRIADLPNVAAVTSVRSDLAHLVETLSADGEVVDRPADGFVIPIEVMAFDPVTYPDFLPKQASKDFVAGPGPGEVILGSTSAEIRGLGPGAVLVVEGGSSFTVSAVVDDVLIGAAEAALATDQAGTMGLAVERYLLVRYSGDRAVLESSIRGELPPGTAVRIRGPGETPFLRHGDAVLPQVLIKDLFGEFTYRPGSGLGFDVDPEWLEANIVTAEVPLLGPVTCHRILVPALSGAMAELEDGNLGYLIDPEGFQGCFSPRYIASSKGISRHSWGAAADINIGTNQAGLASAQDPRLVGIMERWGFTSGDDWLIPDPGHFEYVQHGP